jgi:hypothetical protein
VAAENGSAAFITLHSGEQNALLPDFVVKTTWQDGQEIVFIS